MLKSIHRGIHEISYNTQDNSIIYYDGLPVKVNTCKGYTYKINKTCLASERGAESLYNFLESCIFTNFGIIWVDAITAAMDRMTHGRQGRRY